MANEKRLIDANAFKHACCEKCNEINYDDPCEPSECVLMLAIDSRPTVDAVEVVHGRWIEHHSHRYECNFCNVHFITFRAKYWNYCPNCGAKMDGDGNG